MAKKPADEQLTIAEATRQTWKELGKQVSGVDVANHVKTNFGHDVPSSTISVAKKAVFGTRGRVRRRSSASAGGVSTGAKSKTEIVRELMSTGLNAPKEITEAAKALGVMITPKHVSIIKGNLKRAGDKRRRKFRRGVSAASVAVVAARVTGPATDLELENAALKLALRAGSVQAAMQALSRLG